MSVNTAKTKRCSNATTVSLGPETFTHGTKSETSYDMHCSKSNAPRSFAWVDLGSHKMNLVDRNLSKLPLLASDYPHSECTADFV